MTDQENNDLPLDDSVVAPVNGESQETSTPEPQDEAPVRNTFYTPKQYSAKVTITDPIVNTDGDIVSGPKISLSYTNVDGFTQFTKRSEASKATMVSDWVNTITTSINSLPFNDGLEALMEREADWQQYIEVEGSKLRAGRPAIAKSTAGNVLIGQQAISRITALTSAGTLVKIPLWHSGIWVSIKAPQLSAWVELERRIAMEKVLAGRATRGLSFSNDSVFMVAHVVDFILNHVFDATLQNWTTDQLRQVIKTPDLSYLAVGMALTVFPEGHPYSQACMSDVENCQHVVSGMINLAKTMWVDRNSLTELQRKHMAKRDKIHTLADIEAYQTQWPELKSQSVTLNDALKVVYKVPSLEEYIQAGTTWINQIEEATELAFGTNLRGQQRENYILEQTTASRVGLYSHWIQRFIITEDDNEQIVEDRETIEETVSAISSNLDIANKILDGAKKFIGDRTVSCIGIPNYQCPSCNSWHLTEEGPMQAIIPIDAVATFFILQQSLLTKRLQRQE